MPSSADHRSSDKPSSRRDDKKHSTEKKKPSSKKAQSPPPTKVITTVPHTVDGTQNSQTVDPRSTQADNRLTQETEDLNIPPAARTEAEEEECRKISESQAKLRREVQEEYEKSQNDLRQKVEEVIQERKLRRKNQKPTDDKSDDEKAEWGLSDQDREDEKERKRKMKHIPTPSKDRREREGGRDLIAIESGHDRTKEKVDPLVATANHLRKAIVRSSPSVTATLRRSHPTLTQPSRQPRTSRGHCGRKPKVGKDLPPTRNENSPLPQDFSSKRATKPSRI